MEQKEILTKKKTEKNFTQNYFFKKIQTIQM